MTKMITKNKKPGPTTEIFFINQLTLDWSLILTIVILFKRILKSLSVCKVSTILIYQMENVFVVNAPADDASAFILNTK